MLRQYRTCPSPTLSGSREHYTFVLIYILLVQILTLDVFCRWIFLLSRSTFYPLRAGLRQALDPCRSTSKYISAISSTQPSLDLPVFRKNCCPNYLKTRPSRYLFQMYTKKSNADRQLWFPSALRREHPQNSPAVPGMKPDDRFSSNKQPKQTIFRPELHAMLSKGTRSSK